MENLQKNDFLLGQVKVCPTQNTLSLGKQEISIQPRVMDVLCYLAKHSDRVVSLDELIENLWQGSVVSNHAVHRCISSIRKHFTDLLGEGEYVRSFTKKGYQLCIANSGMAEHPPSITDTSEARQKQEVPTGASVTHIPSKSRLLVLSLSVVVLLAFIGSLFVWFSPKSNQVQHLQFSKVISLTSEPGLEIYPEPHPDNRHFVYAKLRNDIYQLVMRDFDGNEWIVDESPGKWDMFTWSPDGSQLIASSANFRHTGTAVDIYLFELDIERQAIVKKSLIIPWEGDVFSVTWKDDVTLEMTGRYGVRGENSRFRYSIPADKLEKLEQVDPQKKPHIVDIHNNKTALASYYKGGIVIDIFDEADNTLVSKQFETPWLDVSWTPGGDGVLVLDIQKLYLLDLAGNLHHIPYVTEGAIHRPRFSVDGKSILFNQTTNNIDIWLLDLEGQKKRLTEHLQKDSLGLFSASGDTVYYLSRRQGVDQVRAIEKGQDRFVTKSLDERDIVFYIVSMDKKFLIYRTANEVYRYNMETQEHSFIFKDKGENFPLDYFPEQELLYYASHERENTNIWRMNLRTQDKKQITFGTVYYAFIIDNDVYFQYFDKDGLYRLGADKKLPQLVTDLLPANAIYTMVDSKGAYYMTMEHQHLSDSYYLNFATGEISTFLQRGKDKGMATAFHPEQGMLLSIEEESGNIVRLLME